MKYILALYFILFLWTIPIKAQPGFIETFDFSSAANFHNIIEDNNELVIGGTMLDTVTQKWAALLVKMDTFGNVIHFDTYTDSLGSHLSRQYSYPLIKTNSGDYLMSGDIISRQSDFLLFWDADGNVKDFWELPYNNNILTSHIYEIIERTDGYFIFSIKQLDNGMSDGFMTKINLEGGIVWEESYGELDNGESIRCAYVDNDNTIVIGGVKSTDIPLASPSLTCSESWIFAVDTLGQVKWEWTGTPCEETIVRDIHRTEDNGWIYAASKLDANNQYNLGFAPKFVRRDSNFNLLWERQVGETYASENKMVEILPTPEGDWVGVGSWVLPPYYFYPQNAFGPNTPGHIYKVNDSGDSLWLRSDTVVVESPSFAFFHQYGGAVMLESGSVVAAGGYFEDISGTLNSRAWVVKVDKNGCLEELCTTTGIEEISKETLSSLLVYPNPAQKEITFKNTSQYNWQEQEIKVVDITGKVIWEGFLSKGDKQIIWDASAVTSGLYFYQLIENGEVVEGGRVTIQK